jgi:DNA-directed RNA polymerase specialized sigma24 family protein
VLKVSSREIAQDLTQEVFMRFWQTLRDGEKAYNERALLYTIARHLVIDWYRKKKESSLDALDEQGIEFRSNDHEDIEDESVMFALQETIVSEWEEMQ